MSIISSIRKVFEGLYNHFGIKRYKVNLGKNVIIRGKLFVRNFGGELCIGNNVIINSRFEANPIGGDGFSTLVVEEDAILKISDSVGISNTTIYAKKEIIIEEGVMIGGSCKIYDSDFHSLNPEMRLSEKDNDIVRKAVRIKKNAFIGAHTIILKGSVIGEGSVIGAGSVVAGNVPDGEVWAGNPARFIRKL